MSRSGYHVVVLLSILACSRGGQTRSAAASTEGPQEDCFSLAQVCCDAAAERDRSVADLTARELYAQGNQAGGDLMASYRTGGPICSMINGFRDMPPDFGRDMCRQTASNLARSHLAFTPSDCVPLLAYTQTTVLSEDEQTLCANVCSCRTEVFRRQRQAESEGELSESAARERELLSEGGAASVDQLSGMDDFGCRLMVSTSAVGGSSTPCADTAADMARVLAAGAAAGVESCTAAVRAAGIEPSASVSVEAPSASVSVEAP